MKLENVINLIAEKFKPHSIFLYGSKATDSDNKYSDYEIGVIFDDKKSISRQEIDEIVMDGNYSIFSFKLSEIVNYKIDIPFQKEIYLNTLINGGAKTLYGEPVLEKLRPPKITRDNLLADINFNLGVALSSVRVYKSGDYILANELLYKSYFYATRDYIYYKLKKLCITYNEIYSIAIELDELKDFKDLLELCYNLRCNVDKTIDNKYYYKNISYINKFILVGI